MIFTEEHESIRRTVRQFVEKEINPYCAEWEKPVRFRPMNYLKKWVI